MSAYSNGADGVCVECGDATAEEWHLYCGPCFASKHGWNADHNHEPERDVEPTSALRVDGMRALRRAIELLDDEQRLDQPARDRLTTMFCGQLERELEAAHDRAFRLRLRAVGGWAPTPPPPGPPRPRPPPP